MKIFKVALVVLFCYPILSTESQVYLTEGFETGAKPDGWTEETVSGNEPWRYRNGGHSPNDNNWQIPPEQEDITRNPPAAHEGTFNAIFFKQGDNNERTKLITPALDLLGGTSIELSFYLCQIPWTFEGTTGWDVLRVYYKVSQDDPWVLIHEYLDPLYEWELQKLVLPNPSETYYVAFEGHTRWGYGTCIDNISVEETGSQPLYIGEIDFEQPFADFSPSGAPNVPLLRVDFKVFGNTDSAMLDHIHFTSLNTSDSDLQSNGVKLYSTTTQTFSTQNPLGSPTDFVSGIASFTGLSYSLPPGQSYLWLAYDVDINATHGNILDVMVAANGIMANDTLYPTLDESPNGERMVYETRYLEDFEGVHNWTLTGEFEVNTPNGMGGTPGNSNPSDAFSGTMALGTDLSGLGSNPYHYEPGLSESSSYLATSPLVDALYYKNLNLFFRRYLNIEVWDQASIQISTDDGTSWNTIWESNSYFSDFQWIQEQVAIPDDYARTDQLKMRYQLGPTDGLNNYSGWNIDDIYLTGEFISKDVGVSEWICPLSGSGHTASDSVTVRIRNYGGAEITEPVAVAYSFDGGSTWTVDHMTENIPVGGSLIFTFPSRVNLTEPGLKPSVLAKTALPGDQYASNDLVTTQLYIVPTYVPPYMEDFESDDGYWRSMGNSTWEYGTPAGSVIDGASSGTSSWATGLTQQYGDLITQKNRTIFEDDFETDQGWTFNAEFEREIPSNMNLPYFAYSGYYCLGTDLSGQGTSPYNYENGITPGTANTATSPAFDVSNFSNLTVSFASWISIQNGDSIKLELSPDNGSTWYTLWKNSEGGIMETDFQFREYPVHDSLSYSNALRFRFSLFHSSASGPVAEGWNIDDFVLTGDLIDSDPGYLSTPSYDLTGLANPVFEARLWVDTEQDVDGTTLFYSLDDGVIWTAVTNSSGYDEYWNWYTGKAVEALSLNGWSGQSGGWMTVRHLLPAALLNQANVQFRFEFMADKVNNQYDGVAVDDVRIIEAPQDIDVLEILDPVTACELSADQTFTLRLRNSGITDLQSGDSIKAGYYIDRSGEIQTAEETLILTQSLPVGNTQDFSMSTQFDYSRSGDYQTEVYIMNANPHFYQATSNDTVSRLIRVNKPAVDLGENISTVQPDTVVLRAYSGVAGQTYLWQDSSTDSLYHVSTDGTYYVRVTNGIDCVASDTVQVMQLIADVGVSELIAPVSACELGDQLPIEIIIRNFGTDTVEVNDTIFVYGEINHSYFFYDTIVINVPFIPGETMDFTYSERFDFSAPGSYQMKLYTKHKEDINDQNDTLQHNLEVYGYPDIDLGPDTVVLESEYVLSAPPGYFEYLWQDGSALETFTVNQPGQGFYYVTVSDVNQCTSSDSVYVTLNVLDVTLDQILSPATSCELSESITVSARIRNAGNQAIPAGQTIDMGYLIDGGSLEQDAFLLSENLLPGASFDFVFSKLESVTTGQWYEFTVFVDYINDSKSWNDTVIQSVGVFEAPALDLGDDHQVITELEHTLDAGPGFVSYQWQDESTGQTFTITEPGIGVYGVTVTDINGCEVYDEVEIMMAVPDIGILEVSHPQTTCSLGASESIQVAIKNFGNWDIQPSANITVSYSINGASAVSESLVLDGTFENDTVIYHTFAGSEDFSVPGRYELMAFTEYASDLVPTNNIVLVNVDHHGSPVVDIGSGSDTILVYEPITLSVTPGYPSYLWQDGSTDPDYDITDPSAGMYTVVVTGDNGCATHDSVYVSYDVPDIGITRIVSPVSSCELDQNNPVSIEILNNGYYRISTQDTIIITYSVNSGSSVIEAINLDSELPPGQSRVLSFATGYDFSGPGSYRIQVSLIWIPDENQSNDLLIDDVSVWGSPDVEIGGGQDSIKTSLPVILDAGGGFTSYLWKDNSVASTAEVTAYGLFWVTVTDEYGCFGNDSVYVGSLTHTDDLSLPGQIRIFPNPAKEVLNVVFDMEVEKEVILEMFNAVNSLVYREDLKRTQIKEAKIDVHGLAPGSYFLRITADEIPHNYLVIVE
ncbi:MAG: T9SS type A sorting domain-containing protein [Bacteroidales bacterium]|nr:T9SS type A sorting domain-containing protein [Bacteroidales bacterium]